MTARREHDEQLNEMQVEPTMLRAMIETMVQEVLEEEFERHVGSARYARTPARQGYRNGHKERAWKTRVGEVKLQVPQARAMEPYQPSLWARWERSERALLVACAEMYFQGVSTRKVASVLEELGDFTLSAATVSKVAAELD